ncbi:hypothetical protein LZ30DRAFT_279959 [Colletotrichum cereale]|nr:hypothetical protein LZ30DRAFT_279959 [Colletotrichum cereale]
MLSVIRRSNHREPDSNRIDSTSTFPQTQRCLVSFVSPPDSTVTQHWHSKTSLGTSRQLQPAQRIVVSNPRAYYPCCMEPRPPFAPNSLASALNCRPLGHSISPTLLLPMHPHTHTCAVIPSPNVPLTFPWVMHTRFLGQAPLTPPR